jgi:hypothetical protein
VVALLNTCLMSAGYWIYHGRFVHSLISGKYAQNREIGSRTVVLFNISQYSHVKSF